MKRKFEDSFLKWFGSKEGVRYFFAPGRVNLMGDHIDYSGGYTLPCALTMGTYAAVRRNDLQKLRMYSFTYPEVGVLEGDLVPKEYDPGKAWANYPLAVVQTFAKAGYEIKEGLDIVFDGTLPESSGLSSSASIEVLMGYMLCALYGFKVSVTELAKLTQKAENEFIGVQCGILDQLSIAAGKKEGAIFLNTKTLTYEYAPIALGGNTLVIVNSNKKRALNESKYNERRQECEEALRRLQTVCAKEMLCDVTKEEFLAQKEVLQSEVLERRVRHAISENQRTIQAFEVLKKGDIEAFGKLMPESHRSLKEDYEVTGWELDLLVDAANHFPGVLGARMTGGGFGGCVIALVNTEKVSAFKETVGKDYLEKTGYAADFYEARIGGGPCELNWE